MSTYSVPSVFCIIYIIMLSWHFVPCTQEFSMELKNQFKYTNKESDALERMHMDPLPDGL